MRVLHIYKAYLPESFGGTERTIFQICQGTKKHGVVSSIATISKKETITLNDKEAKVYKYKESLTISSNPVSMELFGDFKKLIKGVDILHYHFPWPFADALHLLRGCGKPSIVTYHSDIVKQKFYKKIYAPVMKRFLSSVDLLAVTSPDYLRTSEDLRPYRNKCRVIPIGLDDKGYHTATPDKVNYWNNRLGEAFILFVGVLRYYKGLEYLMEAAKKINGKIVILGEGPLEGELRRKIKELRISNVILLGYVDDEDKAAIIKLCTALIMPSHLRSEAFGVSLLEAAMLSKPLVSCEIGTGTTYININNETGFTLPPKNPEAIQDACNKLLQDNQLSRRLGDGAKKRFNKLFRSEIMCKSYVDSYREILHKHQQFKYD